jgi:hypothetical protein
MTTGVEIVRLAKKHIGEQYILGSLAPKSNSNWKGPWDCAEFVSWCVYQLSTQLYGCHKNDANPDSADAYTGFWARDAKKHGKKISIDEAKVIPGAALLRVPLTNRTGHIVISDGKGGTVEAHSRNRGVISSVIDGRRWDYGILIPWIDYSQTVTPSPVPVVSVFRYTKPMMVSPVIGDIQRALKKAGFNPGKIDNIFGLLTEAAVRAFQISEGLLVDGEVGSETAGKLGITL